MAKKRSYSMVKAHLVGNFTVSHSMIAYKK